MIPPQELSIDNYNALQNIISGGVIKGDENKDLSIYGNNALRPTNAEVDNLLNNIRKTLYEKSSEMVNGKRI